ncbi:MAG: hypothetical protein H8E38_09290 [SAR324 cluster bacterium]|nr:hypothetical protein [SAR324 cluster bacterium]
MDTNFYVVGDNRVLSFLLRNIKFLIGLLLLIITGLSLTIAYLKYKQVQEQELFKTQIEQEKIRSENLISKLKKTGVQDSSWEQLVLSKSSQQKKLNEQQASLIERQGSELSELKSILDQREQVVQQFQLEKKSTQEQINSLQQKTRSLQQQLRSTQATLTESKTENNNIQKINTELTTKISKLELQNKKVKQKAATRVVAVKKQKSKSEIDTEITVEKLRIVGKDGFVSVSYNLTNQSNTRKKGRTGMYLSSKNNLGKTIPYKLGTSIPFRIKRYRVISSDFNKVKAGTFVRILIWNEKKELIFDEAYPIKQ